MATVAVVGMMARIAGQYWRRSPWWDNILVEFGVILCRDYVAVVLKGSIAKTVGRTLLRVEKSGSPLQTAMAL